MTMAINTEVSDTPSRRKFSEQEKQDYYTQWQNSGMTKRKFCKEHGLPANQFYYWCKSFTPKAVDETCMGFSPVVAKTAPAHQQFAVTQLEMRLPNQAQVLITLPQHQLISFIQELCHAVTIVR